MIGKYKILNELKERIAAGEFVEYTQEVKNGSTVHKVRFGNGIGISMDDKSRNMYINFAFNRGERDDVFAVLKDAMPLMKQKPDESKQSLLSKIFSKKK